MENESSKDTYTISGCACMNCSFQGDIVLKKGVKLEDAICDECGIAGELYRKPVTSSYYDL